MRRGSDGRYGDRSRDGSWCQGRGRDGGRGVGQQERGGDERVGEASLPGEHDRELLGEADSGGRFDRLDEDGDRELGPGEVGDCSEDVDEGGVRQVAGGQVGPAAQGVADGHGEQAGDADHQRREQQSGAEGA